MNEYYISLIEPELFRKVLLESSKEIILNMKQYQELQLVRKKTLEHIDRLKLQIKELTFLVDKLNNLIPDREIKYEHELAEQPRKTEKQREDLPVFVKADKKKELPKILPKKDALAPKPLPPKQQPPKKDEHAADLDKLEAALKSIEEKLGRME